CQSAYEAVHDRIELAQPKNLNPLNLCDLGFSKVLMTMGILFLVTDASLTSDDVTRKIDIDVTSSEVNDASVTKKRMPIVISTFENPKSQRFRGLRFLGCARPIQNCSILSQTASYYYSHNQPRRVMSNLWIQVARIVVSIEEIINAYKLGRNDIQPCDHSHISAKLADCTIIHSPAVIDGKVLAIFYGPFLFYFPDWLNNAILTAFFFRKFAQCGREFAQVHAMWQVVQYIVSALLPSDHKLQ
ncbi:hypothetical protein PRIPAC_80451, partial [Pristionchus pacificus]|uniref:Uncharacterized protein n=1 Tax=Pristionchus pacificus TaxID=54126 RepID=A0A2A6CME9_PRIPA